MPRSTIDYSQHIKSLERKLRALRRDILGVADAGREAITDPSRRGFFEATLQIANTDWLEYKRYFDDLADSYLEQDQADVFPNEYWNSIYDELFNEIRTANGHMSTLRKADIDGASSTQVRESDLTQIIRSLTTNSSASKAHLPKITIPEFSGDLWKWTHFRDTFVSLVHQVDGLSDVEKLHYLLGSLKGEAAALISRFPIEDRSYALAWQKLKSTYDNPRVLANVFVQRILDNNVKDIADERKRYERFLSDVADSVEAFKGLHLENPTEFLLAALALRSLDGGTRKQFEMSRNGERELPQCEEVISFVRNRLTAIRLSKDIEVRSDQYSARAPNIRQPKHPRAASKRYNSVALHVSNGAVERTSYGKGPQSKTFSKGSQICPLCKGAHRLCHCPRFQSMRSSQRQEFTSAWKGCLNCLRDTHKVKDCPSLWSCRYCRQRHHSLLHPENDSSPHRKDFGPRAMAQASTTGPNASQTFIGFGCSSSVPGNLSGVILLGTVKALIRGACGRVVPCRAVLDCGSQRSFVTKRLALQLGEPITPCSGSITGLGGSSLERPLGAITCSITPQAAVKELNASCLVVEKITSDLPQSKIDDVDFSPLQREWLADDEFHKPKPVDMLLGCDLYPRLITGAPYSSGIDEIYLLPSLFGNVVIGKVRKSETTHEVSLFTHDEVEMQLKAFWEMEEPPTTPRTSPHDAYCEEHFRRTHTRTAEGRYCVELPLACDPASIGHNREVVTKRFFGLERKMSRDPRLAKAYKEFMQEYEDLRHMSVATSAAPYVIPHHPVWQQKPGGAKLRVVFDASCPSSSKSLNDLLLAGPKLQKDLPNVLTRFRYYKIPLCADLVKMYRQILVCPDHRFLQHVLWRKEPADELQEFQLDTVTYGLKCSAFLAMRVIQQLVEDEGAAFPCASNRVSTSIYVDDIVTGANSLEEAITLRDELCALFAKGGFTLGKWASSRTELLRDLDGSASQSLELDGDSSVMKILGMVWSPRDDAFTFTVRSPAIESATKRSVLSSIARIFDPLGLLAPVILLAKLILQDLWRSQVGWDEPLPIKLKSEWRKLASEWANLTYVEIPRCVRSHNASLSLVGFSDASDRAYSSCIYLRAEDLDGVVTISLLRAKTKVAPLKYLSTARLELCGSLLLAQLIAATELPDNNARLVCFTDSTVVLSWLRTPTHALKAFEANRVSKILETTKIEDWRHVCSKDNPSDLASRGCLPSRLRGNTLWWRGPRWLALPERDWPEQSTFSYHPQDNVALLSQAYKAHDDPASDAWMHTFSSYRMLVRVTAWLLRFRYVSDLNRSHRSQISGEEYRLAKMRCAYVAQRAHLPASLFAGLTVPKELRQLSPFIDSQGVVRVGGRLRHATISYASRHPVLVPKNSHLARLIVDDIHVHHFHAGPTLTLSLLRNQFWIPGGLKYVRSRIFKCVQCTIKTARPQQPLMASLPKDRVTPSRPFLSVGVDYAGPFLIKESKRRNAALGKAYLCLFVCMSTRAVHLEAVSALSTPAFLAALDRMIARRGLPRTIWSDNGTNFVGASRFLKDLYLWLSENEGEITRSLSPKGITWRFIPPRAPNFGGLWEAAVKSAKNLLVSSIGKQPFDFECLSTIFSRVEAILNSRPLTSISEDPDHCDYLTPGHFLIGEQLTAIPDSFLDDKDRGIRPICWEEAQRRVASVWQRWRKEYLHSLQQRAKWQINCGKMKVGDLVILSDRKTLVGHWPVGRVVAVHPGEDNVVRVVTVRTPSGTEMVRAVNSLVPLLSERVSHNSTTPPEDETRNDPV